MGIIRQRSRNIILAVLVILSFFLSFNLWTAGRNMGEEENTGNLTARSNISLVEHSFWQTFRPSNVVLHGADSENPLLIANTYPLRNYIENRMDITNLDEIERTERYSYEDYLNDFSKGEWIEFVYREQQPFGLIDQKFQNLSRESEEDFYDRIIINLNDQNFVYFYNTDTRAFYTVSVLNTENIEVDPFLNRDNLEYVAAESVTLANNIVYLPQEKLDIFHKSYVIDRLPTSSYISNFFPDTSLLDVRSTTTYSRYIDLTKEVTINESTNTLVYLRQIHDPSVLSFADRYSRSFEQINRFENWGDTLSLSEYNTESQVLSFRREINGIPVFSDSENDSLSEIGLVESGVVHLKIPLRFTSTPLSIENQSNELRNGREVIEQIQSLLTEEEYELVEDITIGYAWKESEEASEVIDFEPEWYILYNGIWTDITTFLELHGEVAYGL